MYPRIVELNGEEILVDANQIVSYREHMTQVHRFLFFDGVITNEMSPSNLLLALDSLSHKPIKILITSPGGDLDSTFLIIDTMKLVESPIITIGRYCASAACLILASGDRRYLYPHAKTMLHLPAGQMGGDARDWDIQHKQMQKYKTAIVDILIECGVKKPKEEIFVDIDRDYWLDPLAAIEYGLADEIFTSEIWGHMCQPDESPG